MSESGTSADGAVRSGASAADGRPPFSSAAGAGRGAEGFGDSTLAAGAAGASVVASGRPAPLAEVLAEPLVDSAASADFAAGAGAAFLAVLRPPFLMGSFASLSLRRRSTGASTVDDADRTNSPMSFNVFRTSLLVTPSSFASS
jgi:hypothetical protein